MSDKDLEAKINFVLTTNQVARIDGETVYVDVFRGSNIRRNRTKMATIAFTKSEALSDDFSDLVNSKEAALDLPLVPDEFGWQ